MAYNEPDFAPVWATHYAAELGARNCYIIDHGSTDGSLEDLGAVNVLRIPRSPQDDLKRARFLSRFCASLLSWYDAVFHTDIDEILVADPDSHSSLASYCAADPRPVISATGLDLLHRPDREPPLAPGLPVTVQRRWLRFTSAMCKPVLIRTPVEWAPGFHSVAGPPVFGDLLLFHLRYTDLNRGLLRLDKTRQQPWEEPDAGAHQRMSDEDWSGMLRSMAGLPARQVPSLRPDADPLRSWLDRVTASSAGRENDIYRIDLHIAGDELWRLPRRYVGRF
jgi:hypothetical protein